MDIYKRAVVWAEEVSKDINKTAEDLKRVDPEAIKSGVKTTLAMGSLAAHHIAPEMAEFIHVLEATAGQIIDTVIDNTVDSLKRFTGEPLLPERGTPERVVLDGINDFTADDSKASPAGQAERDAELKIEADIKADAELAAAAIGKLAVELDERIPEERRESEQEADALKVKFENEEKDLVSKLDEMRDNYFEKYPDLDKDQRTDAEGTFKTIKDDAVGALKANQDARLMEQRTQQRELRENLEQRRKELEGTRDERA